MAIKIHHGPNGSYKTSGAMWDDAVPAMKQGRLIITNVRGFTYERCMDLFPDLPDTFDVENIDTESMEGMERARTWFMWAPRDAFIIFDETQNIFLRKWTEKYLEKYDYPGGLDAAKEADRPAGFLDAFTRQRHWNWDIILTTPNIKYIRDDIRQTCEAAYLHANLGLLGKATKVMLNADYKEAMHSAQDNRPSADGTIVAFRKIDKRVFKLYDSTATGQHRDTIAGKSLLGSPKILGLVAFVALLVGVMYYRTGFGILNHGLSTQVTLEADSVVSSAHQKAVVGAGGVVADVVPHVEADKLFANGLGPYGDYQITIKAALNSKSKGVIYMFEVETPRGMFKQNTVDMRVAGYEIRSRGLCAADLTYKGSTVTVVCSGAQAMVGGTERDAERRTADPLPKANPPRRQQISIVDHSSRENQDPVLVEYVPAHAGVFQ